jgi:hypothetical protein
MAYIGISTGGNPPPAALAYVDYVEIKKISEHDAAAVRSLTDKPVYFHIQFSPEGRHLLPTAMDFELYADDFKAAGSLACPEKVSLHFGLSAPAISLHSNGYYAVAAEAPLTKARISGTLEKNLTIIKNCFPKSALLLENQEYIPEHLCGGAYRYIQEADFFSEQVTRWHDMELVDGIVFDIAHALITAGNHPYYNGLSKHATDNHPLCSGPSKHAAGSRRYDDPVQTGPEYMHELSTIPSDKLCDFYSRYIRLLPLHLIREIHISGIHRNDQGLYVDAHNEIGALEFEALRRVLDYSSCIAAQTPVTLEYARIEENIIPQLLELHEYLG